jgi:transposase
MSRQAAAENAGMDRQTLRDWVIHYNAHGVAVLAELWQNGRPSRLTPDEQADLHAIVLAGPDPDRDGFSALRRDDLVAICVTKFGERMHRTSMGRLLRKLDLSRQKARPSHPQRDPVAQAAFKKLPSPAGTDCSYKQR